MEGPIARATARVDQSMRKPRLPVRLAVAVLLVAMLGVVACGDDDEQGQPAGGAASTQDLQKVRLQLDWIPKEEYAFIYGGVEQGIFEKHGIDLQIQPGKGSVLAMQVLGGEAADFAYVNVVAYVQAVGEGAEARAVYGIIQQDPQELLSTEDAPVEAVSDLAGKSLIVASTEGFAQYIPYLLKLHDVDEADVEIQRVDAAAKGPAFASGRADAMNWYRTTNSKPLEEQSGKTFLHLPSAEWGGGELNVAENLLARPDYIEENRDLVERMVAAMRESWEWASDNPEAAAEAVQPLLANAPIDQVTEIWERAVELGHTEASEGKPTGWMAPEDWQATLDHLKASGLAKDVQDPESYYTNEFVE